MKRLLILGAGGHAKVVAEIALKSGWEIEGFLDDKEGITEFLGYPVFGKTEKAANYTESHVLFMAVGNNEIRKQLAAGLMKADFATLIHPSAVIAASVKIGKGSVVMANAVINPGAEIGEQCIINTGAIVEHDDRIESYVHISPGCSLGGGVEVGEGSWLGIGSCVKDHVNICLGCVIGAGAVVVNDIEQQGTYVGIPAMLTGNERMQKLCRQKKRQS